MSNFAVTNKPRRQKNTNSPGNLVYDPFMSAGSKAKLNGQPETPAAVVVATTDPLPESGNLEKVRDILFGQQSRDIERRLTHSEERLRGDLEGMEREGSERVAALEGFFKQELQSLKERLTAESTDRLEASDRLVNQLQADRADAERKLKAQTEASQANLAELREALLEQGKRFGAELKSLRDNTQAALEREVSALRRDKLDRHTLARSLADLALLIGRDGEDPA